MHADQETVTVQVNLEIAPPALQAVVANTKKLASGDKEGYGKIDTADVLNVMISQFLLERDFVTWVGDMGNYPEMSG